MCHPRRGAESRLAARAHQLPTPAVLAEDDPGAIRGCPREPQARAVRASSIVLRSVSPSLTIYTSASVPMGQWIKDGALSLS